MAEHTAVETARITHVLPALTETGPRGSADARAADVYTMGLRARQPRAAEPTRRLRVPLGDGQSLEIWDDCVIAARTVFPFDESFGVGLVPDPRAPLTVDPPVALALLTRGAYRTVYVPAREEDTLHALYAIREACRLRGIVPIGIDEAVAEPLTPVPSEAPQPQSVRSGHGVLTRHEAPSDAHYSDAESVLIAIAHLSLLFLPVLLPAVIWQALRQTNPRVARQAKEAAEFQGIVYAIVLPVLGYAFVVAHAHGFIPASALGLAGFMVLLLAAATCVFAAAIEALRGHSFSYRDLPQRMRHALPWSV